MSKFAISVIIVFSSMCLVVDRCPACESPDVYIWDWVHCVTVGESVEIEACDYSGTNIESWDWDYDPDSGYTILDWYDELGDDYPTSSRTLSFSTTGEWRIDAEATNSDDLTDSDYARVYVIEVDLDGEGLIPLDKSDNLDTISLSIDPDLDFGEVRLSKSTSPGEDGDVSVYYDSAGTNEVALPKGWLLSRGPIPSTLYVKGTSASSALEDVTLTLSYIQSSETVDSDTHSITVVDIDLAATDLDGTVADEDEATTGAFVHFNLDNDNSSDNSLGAPKRPGGDYLETNDTVTGEDDLKRLAMSLDPCPTVGRVVLTIPSCAKVWKSLTKGSTNLVLASGSKTWDLSNSSERDEFLGLCSNPDVCVEGINTGSGNIVLKFEDPPGTEVTSDTIKYTPIAADCGNQPTTEDGQRAAIEAAFENLKRCEWSITAQPTGVYNCIAWSVGISDIWFNQTLYYQGQYWEELWFGGVHYVSIDKKYGNSNNQWEDSGENNDIDAFYQEVAGYTPTASGASDAEAIYYSKYHGAKRKGCDCGAGKWDVFESKCGSWYRIEHRYDQIGGTTYGSPTRFYK